MSGSTPIGLADAIRAMHRLQLRESVHLSKLCEMLFLDSEVPFIRQTPNTPSVGLTPVTERPLSVTPAVTSSAASQGIDSSSEAANIGQMDAHSAIAANALSIELRQLDSNEAASGPTLPAWTVDAKTERWASLSRNTPPRPLHHEPLWPPECTRALLCCAAATASPDGDLDIAGLVSDLAQCRPVVRIPKMNRATLRYGIQLLVDRSDSMSLFARDQLELLRRLRQVIGADRVQVYGFRSHPLHAEFGAKRRGHGPYELPPASTPILVITDLGLGTFLDGKPVGQSHADLDAWLHFAARVRQAGCPLRALVPYPPSHWPRPLRAVMKLLPWDRTATVKDAFRATARPRDTRREW